MHFTTQALQIFAIAMIFYAGLATANDCHRKGSAGTNKAAVENQIKIDCQLMSGVFYPDHERSTMIADGDSCWFAWIKKTSAKIGTMSADECIHRLTNFVFQCDYGGYARLDNPSWDFYIHGSQGACYNDNPDLSQFPNLNADLGLPP